MKLDAQGIGLDNRQFGSESVWGCARGVGGHIFGAMRTPFQPFHWTLYKKYALVMGVLACCNLYFCMHRSYAVGCEAAHCLVEGVCNTPLQQGDFTTEHPQLRNSYMYLLLSRIGWFLSRL